MVDDDGGILADGFAQRPHNPVAENHNPVGSVPHPFPWRAELAFMSVAAMIGRP